MEGEAPTRAAVPFETGGWGHADFLSGGSWLHGSVEPQDLEKKIPAEGAILSYDFDAKTAGDYEAWVRIGYEFARSPFSWRLDGGAWKESKPEELTTDLMALQDWNEVAWLKLGDVTLQPGKHTFEIKFDRQYKIENGKKEPDRILFGLDAICLYKGSWLPNGPYKPDEKESKEIDKQAVAQVFEIKAGSGGERGVTPLGGAWQIARIDEQEIKDRTEPVQELPTKVDNLHWKGITVPGNRDDERPDLQYAHRFVYRARLNVPAEAKGRSCFLHFPCNAVVSSAIVNGVYCGGSKAPCTAWDCDVTKAIKPGEVNEILVPIKDPYYAIANTGDPKNPSVRHMFNMPPDWLYHSSGLSSARYADFPVILQVPGAGMFETPSFVTAGPAYTSDVFALPSVKNKTLGLEISVANPTGAPIAVKIADEVAPLEGGPAEKTFAAKELTVAPGKEETVKLSEKWENPKLWWPDDPKQYVVTTKLTVGDQVIDVKKTKFGFREWEWSGQDFTLNGVPWPMHADLEHNDAPPKDPEDAVKDWRRHGQNTFRYWGYRPWTGKSQEETLDFFDSHGVAVRRSGIFDGEGASYLLGGRRQGPHGPVRQLEDAVEGLGQGGAQSSVDLHLVGRERDHLHQRSQFGLAAAGGAGDPEGRRYGHGARPDATRHDRRRRRRPARPAADLRQPLQRIQHARVPRRGVHVRQGASNAAPAMGPVADRRRQTALPRRELFRQPDFSPPPSRRYPARRRSPAGRGRGAASACSPRCWPRATAGTASPPTSSGSAPTAPTCNGTRSSQSASSAANGTTPSPPAKR